MNKNLSVIAVFLNCIATSTSADERGKFALPYRDAQTYPFAAESFWNVPIGRDAQFQIISKGNESWALQSKDPTAQGRVTAFPFLNADAIGVYFATEADPIISVKFKARPQDPTLAGGTAWNKLFPNDIDPQSFSHGGVIDIHVPSQAKVAANPDHWLVICQPDGVTCIDFEDASFLRDVRDRILGASASFISANNILSRGYLGDPRYSFQHEGVRAPGFSLLGGLIRSKEVAAGRIPHALAFALSQTQQKAATEQSAQSVWPAYQVDSNSLSLYQGIIPLGALFAIPWSTDIETIGLTTKEGKMVARALQEFGGYDVDTATNTFVYAYSELGMSHLATTHIAQDSDPITQSLRLVENNAAAASANSDSYGRPVGSGGGGKPVVAPPYALPSEIIVGKVSDPQDAHEQMRFISPANCSGIENVPLGCKLRTNIPIASAYIDDGLDASQFEVLDYGISGWWLHFKGDGIRAGAHRYTVNVVAKNIYGSTARQLLSIGQVGSNPGRNIVLAASGDSGEGWKFENGASKSGSKIVLPAGVQLTLGQQSPWYNEGVSSTSNNYYIVRAVQRLRVIPGHRYKGKYSVSTLSGAKALLEVNRGLTGSDLVYTGLLGTGSGQFAFVAPLKQPYVFLRLCAYDLANDPSDTVAFKTLEIVDTAN